MPRGRPKKGDHAALKPFPAKVATHADGEKPWFPQPDEPVFDYYKFKFYVDQGAGRSLKTVADEMRCGIISIQSLAKEREWERRAWAYENHLVTLEFEGRDATALVDAGDWEKRRSLIREQAFQLSTKLISKAEKMLDFPLEVVTESVVESEDEHGNALVTKQVIHMPAKWTFRDAASIIQTANTLARLAADMSTNNTTINVQERKVDLTVQVLMDMTSKGLQLNEAKQKLLEVGVDEVDIDMAITKVRSEVIDV